MALIRADRVKEFSTSTGTGAFALAGADSTYRTFASVCAVADTVYYAIAHRTSNEWEVGLGTYSAVNTLTRTAVHASSNANAAVTFTAGTKDVLLALTKNQLETYATLGGTETLTNKTINASSNTITNVSLTTGVTGTLPIANGGTGGTTAVSAAVNLIKSAPNDGAEYTLKSKKISGTPSFYWVDSTGYAPTLDLLFAADKSLTAYTGPTPSFSRASAGTFFNSSGVLKTAAYNLINYSQDFENSYWASSNVIVYSNSELAPDGTLTADKIANNQLAGFHSLNKTSGISIAGPLTASLYVKSAGVTLFGFEIVDNFRAIINLTDGSVVSNNLSSSTVTVTNAGNGWWRVAYSYTSNINRVIFYPNGATSFTGDGVSGVLMWGLQIENSTVANDYVRTTTAAASAPRFNHTFNGSSWVSKGLLIEEQRTNTATYSEDFSNASWIKTTATISANSAAAPDGTTTADLCYPTSTGTYRGFYKSFSSASVATTIFAKSAGKTAFAFVASDGNSIGASFNLSNGTVSNVFSGHTATITPAGNGWYRCSLSATTTILQVFIQDSQGTSGTSTTNSTDGILFWGAQVESGSFPTSYIPTTTAAVTRSADVCQISGADFSSFWNASEGSFALEADSIGFASTGSNRFFYAAQSGGVTFYSLDIDPTLGLEYRVVNSSMQAQLTHTQPNAGVLFKHSLSYKVNDFASSLNGSAVATDTSGTLPTATSLGVGYFPGFNQHGNCHIARLRYYPTRIPNAILQVLST